MNDDALTKLAKRIVSDNRQARERSSDRLSRLIEATVTGDHDELDRINDELTGPQPSGEVSERTGEAETVERSDGTTGDSGHAPGTDAEPESGVSMDTESPVG